MAKKKKERINVVYSTNPDFDFENEDYDEQETLPISEQLLYVSIDRKQRKGKAVTLVQGFVGTDDDLKDLGKLLKTKCGVGGTVKEYEIIIQGELGAKVMELLDKEGYKSKKKGGF